MLSSSVPNSKSPKKTKRSLVGLLFFGCCKSDEVSENTRCYTIKPKRNECSDTTINNHYGMSSLTLPIEFGKENDYFVLNDVFPINEIFILGRSYKIITKITEKIITTFINPTLRDTGNPFTRPIRDEGSHEGSMGTKNLWSNSVINMTPLNVGKQKSSGANLSGSIVSDIYTIPENVAAHIGNRLRCDILIDAMCGSGTSSRQFAKYCNQVIAIDLNPSAINKSSQISKASKDGYNIDFMTANFLHLKNFSADMVFLDPIDNRNGNTTQRFSIFKHLSPDPRELVAKALEVSRSIALKLPYDVMYEEIAELFNVSLKKFGTFSNRFCIEIEKIIDSETSLEFVIVYFGNCSSIEPKEEYEVIYDYFVKKQNQELGETYTFNVVTGIVEKVGIYKACSLISDIEDDIQESGLPIALWSMFKEKLVDMNLFTQSRLDQAIEEESLRPSSSVAGVASSHLSSIVDQKRSGSNLAYLQSIDTLRKRTESNSFFNKKPNNEPIRKITSKFANTMLQDNLLKQNDSPLLEIRKSITEENPDIKETIDVRKDYFSRKSRAPSPKLKFVDSEDLSDLNVSSYSVNSGYLRDSILDRSSQVGSFRGDDENQQIAGDDMLGKVLFDVKPVGRSSTRKLSDDEVKPVTSLLHKTLMDAKAERKDKANKRRVTASKKSEKLGDIVFRKSYEPDHTRRSKTTKESDDFEITEDISTGALLTTTVKGF